MPLRVLAVNVGSSSVRLDVWNVHETTPQLVFKVDGIGEDHGTLSVDGQVQEAVDFQNHTTAIDALLGRIPQSVQLDCIGHRLVHGGSKYHEPVWIDDKVLADLDELVQLVPLHLPPSLHGIKHLRRTHPHLPQAAVFDTAFHATLPSHAAEYALPATWRAGGVGVRRYGFHGLACADALFQLGNRLRERTVLLHLGAGCSATAILRGQSVDTTMGLTPLEGLVMATRCGDLDPGILLYLQRERRIPLEELDYTLNHGCGLLGLSALSGEMKTLLSQTHLQSVALAIEIFCYRAAKAVGGLAVALGGCEQIVFTGGIGEHAAPVRGRIAHQLEFLGVQFDEDANRVNAAVISRPESAVAVHIIRIDEGRQIAQQTAKLASGHGHVA